MHAHLTDRFKVESVINGLNFITNICLFRYLLDRQNLHYPISLVSLHPSLVVVLEIVLLKDLDDFVEQT